MLRLLRSVSSIAVAASTLASTSAIAQDTEAAAEPEAADTREDDKDDIIVTGLRTARAISAIPNSISVIEAEELRDQFAINENLNSLLTFSVPGFVGRSTSIQQPAVLRGRTALILIDGVPQNQLLRSSGFDVQTLAPEAIERVEVLRGANAVFGFGATGGVVNFITKRPPQEGTEVILKARTAFQTANAEPSREIYGQAATRIGRWGVIVGAGFDDLEPVYDGTGTLIPNENTEAGRDITNVHAAVDFEISSSQRLRFNVNYFDRADVLSDYALVDPLGDPAADVPAGGRFADAFFTDFDALYYGTDEVTPDMLAFDLPGGAQTFTNATLTYQNDDVLGSRVEITGLFHDFDLTFPYFRFLGVNLQQVRERQRYGVRASVDTPLDFLGDGARLVWGADYIEETVDEGGNIGDENGITRGTRTTIRVSPFITQRATGFWGGVEVPLGSFLLSGGIRHDRIDATLDDANFDTGGFFEGGDVDYTATLVNAGIIWYAAPDIDVYASYTQGFDVTDIGRAAFQVPTAAEIDPQPAITDQFEIGTRARFDNFSLSLAGFYADSELAARTIRVPGQSIAVPLRQPEQVWGVEATWNWRASETIDLGGTFAWNDGERELPNGTVTPIQNRFLTPVTLTGQANWKPVGWFEGRIQAVHNFASDDFDGSTAFGEGDFENFTQVDLLARFDLAAYGVIDLGIANLFDRVDIAPGDRASNGGFNFIRIPGRTVSVGYTWRFGG